MDNSKDMLVISHLRQNARENLTKMSKETGIPISTLFDMIRRHQGGIIKKNTILLDFSKLGFEVRVSIALKIDKQCRDSLKEFLVKEQRVNSVYKINNGYDFLVECVFRNMNEVNDFVEKLEQFKVKDRKEYYILDEIKREAFMNDPEYLKVAGV